MEGLSVGSVTDILQLVAIVGGIAIFWWKVPSRREMEKADDILRASIVALTARVDAGFDRTSEKFDRISEKFDRMSDKMDANAQTFHADIIKLVEIIEAGNSELRAEIRNLNRDHKAHLAQHAEQK